MAIVTEYRAGSTTIQFDDVNSTGLTAEQKQKNWRNFSALAKKLVAESFAGCTQEEIDSRVHLARQKSNESRERAKRMEVVFDKRKK